MNENESSLNQIFNDVADSIRAKLGTQAGIKPIDFSDNIDNITGGGATTKSDVSNYLKGQLEGIALTPLFTSSDLNVTSSYGSNEFNRNQEPYKSSGSYDWHSDSIICNIELDVENTSEYDYIIFYNDTDYENSIYTIKASESNYVRLSINPETYNNSRLIVMKEQDLQKTNYLVMYDNGVNESQYHVDVTVLGQTRLGEVYVTNDDLNAINYDPDAGMYFYSVNTNTLEDNANYWIGSVNEISSIIEDNKYTIATLTGNSINDFIYGYLTVVQRAASKEFSNITVKVYDTVQEQYVTVQKPNIKFIDSIITDGCNNRGIYFYSGNGLSNEIINNKTYLVTHIEFDYVHTNLTLSFTINLDGTNYTISQYYAESPVGNNVTVQLELSSYIANLLSVNNAALTLRATGGQPEGVKFLTLDIECDPEVTHLDSVEVHDYDEDLMFEFTNLLQNQVVKVINTSFRILDENDNELYTGTLFDAIINKGGTTRLSNYIGTNLYSDAAKIEISYSERVYTDIQMTYIGSHTGLVENLLCYAPTNYIGQTGTDYEIYIQYSNTSENNYRLNIRFEENSNEHQHTVDVPSGELYVGGIWSSESEPVDFECTVTSYLAKNLDINISNDQTSNIALSQCKLTSFGEVRFNIANEDDSYNANIHLDTLYLADTNDQKVVDVDDSQFAFISEGSNINVYYTIDNFTQSMYNSADCLTIDTLEYTNKTQSLTLVNTTPNEIVFNDITLDLSYNEIAFEVENTAILPLVVQYYIKLYDSNDNVVYNDLNNMYSHHIENGAVDTYTDGVFVSFEDLGITPTKIELVGYGEGSDSTDE